MKTKLLALVCAFLLLLGTVPAAGALTGETERAADTLYTLGLVRGTGSGYALSAAADRYTAAVLLVRLAGAERAASSGTYGSAFADVAAWARSSVRYANAAGWISGLTATFFGGSQALSANAWCAFLLRMLGYSDAEGDFAVSGAAVFARHIGLLSRDYSGTLDRGDLFAIAQDALTFPYKGTEETVLQRLVSRGTVSRAAANALGLLTEELTARQISDRYSAAVFQMDSYEGQIYVDAQTPSSNASGFFISADGLAVTNYHAIKDSIYSTVTLVTGESYPVEKVLYYDAGIDIAVIRVSRLSTQSVRTSAFAYLETVSTADVRDGDTVYTLGYPLGLGLCVSSGIVASRAKTVENYTLPMIQNTADISMGSSGGALFNAYGQVIGVTTGAYTYGNSMYLAVPIDAALTADLTGAGWTLAQVAEAQKAADAAAKSAA